MPVSKRQQGHVAKYNAKAYDQITLRVPKGTLGRIKTAAPGSVNGLINQLINDWLQAVSAKS